MRSCLTVKTDADYSSCFLFDCYCSTFMDAISLQPPAVLRMQPVSDSIIYEVLFQNPVQSPMTVSFSVDYRFWLCNTHAVVWIRPHGKPLILTPETASTEVSWVLGGWSLFALCACRSRILPTPFHLISGFLSFHQTCWYLSFLLKSQPVYFHLHY